MIPVWHHFFGPGDAPVRCAVIAALLNAGIATQPLKAEIVGAGIVFFNQVTAELCNFVRQISRNGLERVLTIAFSGSALCTGSTWRLLQHGASDVFAWDHSDNPAKEVAERFS